MVQEYQLSNEFDLAQSGLKVANYTPVLINMY